DHKAATETEEFLGLHFYAVVNYKLGEDIVVQTAVVRYIKVIVQIVEITFWLKKTVRIIGVDAVKIGTVVIAKVADVIIFGAHKIVGAKTVYARNFIKAKGTFVTEFCFAVH